MSFHLSLTTSNLQMASRRPALPRAGGIGALIRSRKPQGTPICPFCSIAPSNRGRSRSRGDVVSRRFQSTITNATNPRAELEQALLDLQKQAPAYVNLSRLQLALQGLRQAPGQEAVRVAILGLANGSDAGITAKNVLRVLLADPLQEEQEWERELRDHDPKQPLIVRVGPVQDNKGSFTISRTSLLHEIHVSSAEWNGLNLELLFMEINSPATTTGDLPIQAVEDALLVPAVDIPSAENRVVPVTTPVHKSLLIANGMTGAVNVTALPILEDKETILSAVDLKGIGKGQLEATFEVFDASRAEKAVSRFREGPGNAMDYERLWFASNLPALVSWLKSGVKSSEDSTKPAVRRLIASLLQNALATVQTQESQKLSGVVRSSLTSPILSQSLNQGLAAWAQKAHAELQDELDLAFTGRRWRKLGWWQLFWRVDDVAMLTNEMLSQRFLPTAEQELVYLTGRIAEEAKNPPKYPQPLSLRDGPGTISEMRRLGSGELAPMVPVAPPSALPKWPGHIAFTRRYLQNETIPALQALAQRLVIQSLGTSGVTTSLAALLYISSFSSTVYEAGAVAALGIMYSLSRLQKKWEAARGFWEGEVREEGRKAVRGAEESVSEVLDGGKVVEGEATVEATDELANARELVAKAEDALARMK
ncbi:Fc.00g048980.m01.CDS01 [Cosmosporella sp. VM-42]